MVRNQIFDFAKPVGICSLRRSGLVSVEEPPRG
jgi:hypothetical protein